jgi:hypothetical protein
MKSLSDETNRSSQFYLLGNLPRQLVSESVRVRLYSFPFFTIESLLSELI